MSSLHKVHTKRECSYNSVNGSYSPEASTTAIGRILAEQERQQVDDGSGDVVYALFLEPHDPPPGTTPSWLHKAVDFCVRTFQSHPVMAHVELVVPAPPDSKKPINFATYMGESSGWNLDRQQNTLYYLSVTGGKWRAVPVFGSQAARKVRDMCDQCQNVDYSMLRYLTATPPLRAISGLVPDGLRAPAHCATLTARVLRRAVGGSLDHKGAYYGPASLYAELTADLQERRIAPETTVVDVETQRTVQTLLHDPLPSLKGLTDGEVLPALRMLTLKATASEAFGDDAVKILAQRQLASALLRWSCSREVELPSGAGGTEAIGFTINGGDN